MMSVDLLDILDIGTKATRGHVRTVFGLTGGFVLLGWAICWPVVHPFVQSILDDRAERMADAVLSAVP